MLIRGCSKLEKLNVSITELSGLIVGVILSLSGFTPIGLLIIAIVSALEIYDLFRSQIIVQHHNNLIMEKILENIKGRIGTGIEETEKKMLDLDSIEKEICERILSLDEEMTQRNMYNKVIEFWFNEIEPKQWWQKDKSFDELIERRFSSLHCQAKS